MTTDIDRLLETLPSHGPTPERASDAITLCAPLRRPRTVLPSDIALLPWVSVNEDFYCIQGWSVPGLHWYGVPLSAVLQAYDFDPAGRYIEVGAGEYAVTLDPEEAQRAVLTLWLDGLPLAAEHGGPVRLLVREHTCSSSVKWVDRVAILDH
jgi:DMSO/TMAO reductase YedYZ molybdopterin-dependent catalytic subunit